MNTIYLCRHGQDEDNAKGILNGHRNTSLTDLGINQAREVSKTIGELGIDTILSSPLSRAYETAKIIADKLNIADLRKDDLLIERDFGILTGKPIKDINLYAKKRLESDGVNYFLEAQNAEDFPSLYKRAQTFLDNLEQNFLNKTILVVTHGDIGKMIRAVYHKWSWEQGLKTHYFDNTHILKLGLEKDRVE